MKNSPQRTLLFAVLAALALVASACGQTRGVDGNAASFDLTNGETQEISNAELSEVVNSIASSQRFLDAISSGELDTGLESRILTALITEKVMDKLLVDLGGTVDAAAIAEAKAEVTVQLGQLFVDTPADAEEVAVEIDSYITSIARFSAKQRAIGDLLVANLPEPSGVDQPCASHILVATLPEAEDLVAQLDAGADFAELATELSLDPGSGAAGGALGCADPAQYVPEFKEAIENGAEGELLGPIETQFGFHLIIVTGSETVFAPQPSADELLGQQLGDEMLALMPTIDEAVGIWDPASGSVVPPVASPDQ